MALALDMNHQYLQISVPDHCDSLASRILGFGKDRGHYLVEQAQHYQSCRTYKVAHRIPRHI
jgi:hypothetical protein